PYSPKWRIAARKDLRLTHLDLDAPVARLGDTRTRGHQQFAPAPTHDFDALGIDAFFNQLLAHDPGALERQAVVETVRADGVCMSRYQHFGRGHVANFGQNGIEPLR